MTRFFLAAPPATTLTAANDFGGVVAFATPFVATAALALATLSMSVQSDGNAKVAVSIYATDASQPGFHGRPMGAPLVGGTISVKRAGIALADVSAQGVTLSAGSNLWTVISVVAMPGLAPKLAASDGKTGAFENLVGAAAVPSDNDLRPVAALSFSGYLPGQALSGVEPWADVRGSVGAPAVWLGG